MRRLDAYVQHLVRHDAREIVFVSGKPVRFRFPTGDRESSTSLDHGQLTDLVSEVAPPGMLADILRGSRVSFSHAASEEVVQIEVEATSRDVWRVVMARSGGSVAGAAAPAQPARPEIASAPHTNGEVDRFLRRMVELGASDLHLTSGNPPLVRVSGELRPIEDRAASLSDAELRAMLLELIPAGPRKDFEETNDADFAYTIEGVARFRTNYFVDRKGIGGVFRQIPFKVLTPEELGLPPQVLDLCWLTKGLVLVTGPTGSGKSTTIATLIDFVNRSRSDHIITIEDPIEFVHENKRCLVNQREVGAHTGSFKSALRAALREDPDIVLVGEMRDLETIAIAIETAETGHLVFGTLHTTTAASTVDRIIDQFPSEQQEQIRTMLAESLRGVIAQVLCRRADGKGRVAAYEILIATPAVANIIREGKTFQITSMMQTGKNMGMQTMNEHLLSLVRSGHITPEEAYMKSNEKVLFKELLTRAQIALKL